MKNRAKTKILAALAALVVAISLFSVAAAAAPANEVPEFEFVKRPYDTLAETGLPIAEIKEYFSVTPEVKYENGKYMVEDIGAYSASVYNNVDYEETDLTLENGYWVCEMPEEEYNDTSMSHLVRFVGADGIWRFYLVDGVPENQVNFFDNGSQALMVQLDNDSVKNSYYVQNRYYVDLYEDGVLVDQTVRFMFEDNNDYFYIFYNQNKEASYVELWYDSISSFQYYYPGEGWFSSASVNPDDAVAAPVGYESADLEYFTSLAPTTIDCTHPSKIPADCENPETCAVCGLISEGSVPLPHDWLDATYDAPKTCDRCGATEGEPLPPPCDHYNSSLTPNDDMTHTRTCYDCGETKKEACRDDYSYDYSETEHWNICECGRKYESAEHTFEEKNVDGYTLASHWIYCDSAECNFAIIVAHEDKNSDGECDLCEAACTEIFDVYVCGEGLKDGQYINKDGNVSDTEPLEGGYAHYEDGTLTLHNFKYTGEGMTTKDYADGYSYKAPIYVTSEITLVLSGESRIDSVTEAEEVWTDGIYAEASITVMGDGSLEIHAGSDGINMDKGDLTVESGHLILGWLEYDEYGDDVKNEEIGDDAIDIASGNLTINGGKVTVNSDDNALDIEGNITVSGGVIYIVSDDDGFNAEKDINVSGGIITVFADDHAFDSDSGSITISGGVISLHTEELNAISSEKDITVSGGDISVFTSYDAGIRSYSGKFDMSGGRLTVVSPYCIGIYAEEISVSGGELNVSSVCPPFHALTVNLSGGRFGFDASAYLEDGAELNFDSDSNTWSFESDDAQNHGVVIAIVAISVAVLGAGGAVLAWFVIKKKKTV